MPKKSEKKIIIKNNKEKKIRTRAVFVYYVTHLFRAKKNDFGNDELQAVRLHISMSSVVCNF